MAGIKALDVGSLVAVKVPIPAGTLTVGLELAVAIGTGDAAPFGLVYFGTDVTFTGAVPAPGRPLNQGFPVLAPHRPLNSDPFALPQPPLEDDRGFVPADHFNAGGSVYLIQDHRANVPAQTTRVYAKWQ